jgi:formate C-acetyltransferase
MSAATEQERIARLRFRYQQGRARLSVERARYYTEAWQQSEGSGKAPVLRVAEAMRHVYAKMTHYVDVDDRLAGHWTEGFFGMPIDIERGVFNTVLATELSRWTMLRARVKASRSALGYLLGRRGLRSFLREQRQARAAGAPPLDLGLKTMAERSINPFDIAPADARELRRDLLPRWQGRTLVDRLERDLTAAGICTPETTRFAMAVPGATSRQVVMLSTAATIATLQGHVILDYATVVQRGLDGMRADLLDRRRAALTPEQTDTLEAMLIALDGVALFASRLAERIEMELAESDDPARQAVLRTMLDRCRRVPLAPAATFAEGLQSIWTVKTAVELAHPVNLHCFGRLDQDLGALYEADLAAGRITPEEAEVLVAELLIKLMAQNIRPESNILGHFYHRFFGSSPVTLGGMHPDGSDAGNALTELFIRAAHRARAVTNISLRIHDGTPDALLELVAACMHEGSSCFSLFNDATHVDAMRSRGFAEADAYDYAIMGCVEATCPGKTGSMGASAMLLSRLLDITLRGGTARTPMGLMPGEGLATGDPDSFADFEQLVDAYLRQGRAALERIVAGSNLRDRLFAEVLPAPYISAFMGGCSDSLRDVTAGGAVYDLTGVSLINSIANTTDGLLAIKHLVYRDRRFTVRRILEAVDADFVGHEDVLAAIRQVQGKWGNGAAESDLLARRLMQGLIAPMAGMATFKGGPVVPYAISMTTHTIDGRLSIASADGRRAATPYAASCNPYNVERAGVTAALRSVAALPHDELMGCAVNVRFHPNAVGAHAEARRKWVSLVRTYMRLGGGQLQPTVLSGEQMREAQRRPEAHRDLIVKVGGYSTYFVDLGREIQDEIIARTEHAC